MTNKTFIQYYSHSSLGLFYARCIVKEKNFEVKNRESIEESKLPEYAVAYEFFNIKDKDVKNKSKTYVLGNEVHVDSIPSDFYNDTDMVKNKYKSKGIEKLIHLRTNHYEPHKELDRKFDDNWELINCEIKK